MNRMIKRIVILLIACLLLVPASAHASTGAAIASPHKLVKLTLSVYDLFSFFSGGKDSSSGKDNDYNKGKGKDKDNDKDKYKDKDKGKDKGKDKDKDKWDWKDDDYGWGGHD